MTKTKTFATRREAYHQSKGPAKVLIDSAGTGSGPVIATARDEQGLPVGDDFALMHHLATYGDALNRRSGHGQDFIDRATYSEGEGMRWESEQSREELIEQIKNKRGVSLLSRA